MHWTSKIAAAGAFIALVGVSSAASAVTSFTATYDITAHNSDPGLVIQTAKLHDTLNFSLNEGEWYEVDLFKIWTNEGAANPDDYLPANISVDFNFLAPPGSGSATGTTAAASVFFFGFPLTSWGELEWDGPTDVALGSGDGLLRIILEDVKFNVGLFDGLGGHGGTVGAKFKLISEPVSQVPLPAALPLFATALGGLFLFRRRDRAA